jgi:hypothetical protein
MVTLIASKTVIDIIYFCLANSHRKTVNYAFFARRAPIERIYGGVYVSVRMSQLEKQ